MASDGRVGHLAFPKGVLFAANRERPARHSVYIDRRIDQLAATPGLLETWCRSRERSNPIMHTLPVRPETPLADIQAQLGRQRAQQIALVLPLGAASQLADAAVLRQLALFCQHIGKEVSIIGGDDRLRALAVAVGFVVATSLEEHEQRLPPQMVRRHQRDAWEDAYAQFAVRRSPRTTRPRLLDDESALDEPPDYVRRLLDELPPVPIAFAEPVTAIQGRSRTTHPLFSTEDDIVRETYETDEETVTENIRATGKLVHLTPAIRLSLLARLSGTPPEGADTL